ncbi:uncharacterized protein LOC129801603 [Phlebotomus papatasi]|uniref:uncharacterized protein LOC129801603 n=1 Tax=Phlebotomus papatasi TaxID=29031 RepID=UPI0024833BC2|nr:uncharacterized protein LOC129801603 [Phlebotomus papatasi]
MTIQYQPPQWMHQVSSTSDGGVSAFVAGNSGSTGTVFQPSLAEESTANADESFATAESDPEVSSKTEIPKTDPEVTEKVSLPEKKVQVLEESDEDQDDFFEDRRRPNSSKSKGIMLFPMKFGSTDGAAIAIANSYSTGRGGNAVSHATAYGNPMEKKKFREIP